MNLYIRALLPTLFKTLIAFIAGAIVAFGAPLLTVLGNLQGISSGEIEIANLLQGSLAVFITVFFIIYLVWTLFQLIWAFVKGRKSEIKPAKIPEEKIEEMKQEVPDQVLKESKPKEDVDKYFAKYLKKDDKKGDEESTEKTST